MKKVISVLSVLVLFFCLSPQAFAYTTYSPSRFTFVVSKGNYYSLAPPIDTSQFNAEQLAFWEDFKAAYNKANNLVCFMVTPINNSSGVGFYLSTNGLGLYSKAMPGGVTGVLACPAFGSELKFMYYDFSTATISNIVTYNSSTYPYICDKIWTIFWKNTNFPSLPSAASYVDWGGKQLILAEGSGEHTLSIQYLHENGSQAAQPYSASLQEGRTFSVNSPTVNGYTPSQSQISGSMGNKDLNYTVTYKPIKHTLSIQYLHEDGSQAAQPYSASLQEGQTFSVYSPALNGYSPSQSQISGSMGTEDLSYTVTYKPIKHTLTIQYLHEDGSQAVQPYSVSLQQGQAFSVPTPVLDGYTPSLADISGTMGSENLSYTVTFTKIPEPTPPPSSSEDSSGSGDSSSEDSSSGDSSAGNSGGSPSDDSGNASSDIDGGYIIWDPGVISRGFQNVSKQAGTAFNVGIWVFLGIAGIILVTKLVQHLFK